MRLRPCRGDERCGGAAAQPMRLRNCRLRQRGAVGRRLARPCRCRPAVARRPLRKLWVRCRRLRARRGGGRFGPQAPRRCTARRRPHPCRDPRRRGGPGRKGKRADRAERPCAGSRACRGAAQRRRLRSGRGRGGSPCHRHSTGRCHRGRSVGRDLWRARPAARGVRAEAEPWPPGGGVRNGGVREGGVGVAARADPGRLWLHSSFGRDRRGTACAIAAARTARPGRARCRQRVRDGGRTRTSSLAPPPRTLRRARSRRQRTALR